MVYVQQQKGSPWFQNLIDAEKWLNEKENQRLDIDKIKRPNTKRTFVKFANIEVKAVFGEQPLLGKGPLPDWLRNLAHSRQMASLDTFDVCGAALLFTSEPCLIGAHRPRES